MHKLCIWWNHSKLTAVMVPTESFTASHSVSTILNILEIFNMCVFFAVVLIQSAYSYPAFNQDVCTFCFLFNLPSCALLETKSNHFMHPLSCFFCILSFNSNKEQTTHELQNFFHDCNENEKVKRQMLHHLSTCLVTRSLTSTDQN